MAIGQNVMIGPDVKVEDNCKIRTSSSKRAVLKTTGCPNFKRASSRASTPKRGSTSLQFSSFPTRFVPGTRTMSGSRPASGRGTLVGHFSSRVPGNATITQEMVRRAFLAPSKEWPVAGKSLKLSISSPLSRTSRRACSGLFNKKM